MALSTSEAKSMLSINGSRLYNAALPGYPRNFSRDSLTAAELAEDTEDLEAQIAFSAIHQGVKTNPFNGEEPGKIHHELDPLTLRGVTIDDLVTTYNGCDTTALWLRGVAWIAGNHRPQILKDYAANIEAALGYIYSHLDKEYLFREDPWLAGAGHLGRFALKVTYWKDSVLNANSEEPSYPITYTLAHFQNAAALREIGRVMDRPELLATSSQMEEAAASRLWRAGNFITALDGKETEINPPSSDSLHCLFYIEPQSEALPVDASEAIEEYMHPLETKAGYRTGMPIDGITDNYHVNYVWTHEQAILHSAAEKHKMAHAKAVAARVLPYFNGSFPELIRVNDLSPSGNPVQLWAVAASRYFARSSAIIKR